MNEFNSFYIFITIVPIVLGVCIYFVYQNRKRFNKKNLYTIISWNILLILFLMASIFWGGETYYRFYKDTTDSFGLTLICERWLDRHYESNNFYARDNVDYTLRKPKNKRRITFIGDSFTAGFGVKNVDHRFTNIIRSKNPDLDIHTMAKNGFESGHHYGVLSDFKHQKYELDIVVLIYNLNDIAYLVPESREIYNRIYAWENNLNYFGKNSYLLNTYYFHWKAMDDPDIKNYYDYLSDVYFSDIWDVQARNLKMVKNVVKKQKGKLIVVTFPFLTDLSENYKFRKTHLLLQEYWGNQGVPHLDLYEVFKKHKEKKLTVNDFDAHPNEQAHEIAADEIEVFIKENL